MSVTTLFGNINHQNIRDMYNTGDGAGLLYLVDLGAPVVADADRYFASADMDNKTYALLAQPDVPRNVTLARTQGGGGMDTPGIITVTGTNYLDEVITEVITPGATTVTVAGTKAFKTITSIIGTGWAQGSGTDDTIVIGCGTELGLPFALKSALDAPFGVFNGTMRACLATVTDPPTVEGTTVDLSAGTYDGADIAQVLVRYSA